MSHRRAQDSVDRPSASRSTISIRLVKEIDRQKVVLQIGSPKRLIQLRPQRIDSGVGYTAKSSDSLQFQQGVRRSLSQQPLSCALTAILVNRDRSESEGAKRVDVHDSIGLGQVDDLAQGWDGFDRLVHGGWVA